VAENYNRIPFQNESKKQCFYHGVKLVRKCRKYDFEGIKFQAFLMDKGQHVDLGIFDQADETAKIREKCVKNLIGPHASLNFPSDSKSAVVK